MNVNVAACWIIFGFSFEGVVGEIGIQGEWRSGEPRSSGRHCVLQRRTVTAIRLDSKDVVLREMPLSRGTGLGFFEFKKDRCDLFLFRGDAGLIAVAVGTSGKIRKSGRLVCDDFVRVIGRIRNRQSGIIKPDTSRGLRM